MMVSETDKLLSFIYDFLADKHIDVRDAYRKGFYSGKLVCYVAKGIGEKKLHEFLKLKEERQNSGDDDIVLAFINGFITGVSVGWE